MLKLNETQKLASTNLKDNISLVAGAGTGKTRVLKERFINIVKAQGGRCDNILAITFTEKAANEMNNRICEDLANLPYSSFLENLNIMTIHSFCRDLISSYSRYVNINPQSIVDSEWTCANLFDLALNEILDKRKDDLYFNFILDFDINKKIFKNIIAGLYNKIIDNGIGIDDLENLTFKNYSSAYKFEDLRDLLIDLSSNKSFKKLRNFMEEDFDSIFAKDIFSEEDLNLVRDLFSSIKKENPKITKVREIISSLSLSLDKKNHPYYKLIFEILWTLKKSYEKMKRDNKLLDYNDLLFYAQELVSLPEIKNKLKSSYDYILVDEFQDTNMVQNEIIKSFEGANLFIVGDPKQSIYSFRGSDIYSYYEMTKTFEEEGISLNMDINYRTDAKIIEDINLLFQNKFDNYQGLEGARDKTRGAEYFIEEDDRSFIKLIKSLLKTSEMKDIAILARTNNEINSLEEILKDENIPVNKGTIKLKNLEIIKFSLNFIELIYNNNDFKAFSTYISSPFVNLSFDYLVKVLLRGVRDISKALDLEIDYKYKKAIDFYKKYANIKNSLALDDLIKNIIGDLANFTIDRNDMDYLYEFYNLAVEFTDLGYKNLGLFSKYLDIKETEDLSKGLNLLTIHSSKGLEFNNVVIYNMSKSLNLSSSWKVNFDREYGLAINSDRSSGKYFLVEDKYKNEGLEEEKRILYVAMTRARDRLILVKKPKDGSNSYISLLESYDNLSILEIQNEEEFKALDKKARLFLDNDIEFLYKYRQNYSVTDFLNYKLDPKAYFDKFFFDKEVKVLAGKTFFVDAKNRGNIIHLFAKTYREGENIDSHLKSLFKFFREDINQEKFKEIKDLANNYLKLKDKDILFKELEYFYDFRGNIVRGFIDQIIYNKGIYIVDLKTSDLNEEELLKYYSPQLRLYSKIFGHNYKKEVKGAYIYSLKHGKKIPVDLSREAMKKTEDEFFDFIEKSKKLEFK
ncbi:UvrD-helicase domain-containing protein [Peptoniphilus raoultii]|uniref:UvrD-helicase domain-containing protein n=1 Tax=Peptoniphilus raoultii TaxID=1776387 RepID=UPI0009F26CE2|nr:UvrD-helicase domain-containing protein [Peptoniphilus raoultii]